MLGGAPPGPGAGHDPRRWLAYLIILGLYLSLRGYHSYDGDQAYRLPLLLHQQDPSLYATDPFVLAFDGFNPHRGSLFVLDLATRPFGLSLGLFAVFALTFAATCWGIDRLARGVWPEHGSTVGIVAVALVLTAKAGNIGTNHLFEAMLLDRLMAFALGWLALAGVVIEPERASVRAAGLMGLATFVHPSAGLQLAALLAASWAAWAIVGRSTAVAATTAARGIAGLALAVVPALAINVMPGGSLQGNLPDDLFWLLSVELQSPQHMLPHLWRMPQWLAASCYLALAALSLRSWLRPRETRPLTSLAPGNTVPAVAASGDVSAHGVRSARLRLASLLLVILAGLSISWYAIEFRHHVRLTVFQPFRMATIARGVALVMLAGRLVTLWRRGDWLGRMRVMVIALGLTGDWLLVVVTIAELAVSLAESIGVALRGSAPWRRVEWLAWFSMVALGVNFLGHHDTEYGHVPLLAVLGIGLVAGLLGRWAGRDHWTRSIAEWARARPAVPVVLAWIVPLASLVAAALPAEYSQSSRSPAWALINRCRFAAVPLDDIERLGLWCRDHTPSSARFIGPPGPKTFRLWSRRSLVFNRAASPYDGAGLADWFARFQDHVDFRGLPAEFVRSYVSHRHEFESRYQAQSDTAKAALALRQGAGFVIAAAPATVLANTAQRAVDSPLELLHAEGRYAVYRVVSDMLVHRQR
jgi:hypothetical protein